MVVSTMALAVTRTHDGATMWVEAVLSRDDLKALIAQVLPLKIQIHPESAPDQYIELASATNLALVADEGLRMTTQARIHWPVLGIAVPITIDPLSVIIRPRVTKTPEGDALSFAMEIERADFSGLLALGDHAITHKINSELAKEDVGLAWAFAAMLSHRFDLPPMLAPFDAVALNVAWGKVRVTDEAMVMAISFHAQVSRRADGVVADSVVASPETKASDLAPPSSRALTDGHSASLGPMLQQLAVVGGAALAIVGAFVTVRGAGRIGARVLRSVTRG